MPQEDELIKANSKTLFEYIRSIKAAEYMVVFLALSGLIIASALWMAAACTRPPVIVNASLSQLQTAGIITSNQVITLINYGNNLSSYGAKYNASSQVLIKIINPSNRLYVDSQLFAYMQVIAFASIIITFFAFAFRLSYQNSIKELRIKLKIRKDE
jgi:hypothetical protein